MTRRTRHLNDWPTRIKKIAYNIFFELMVLLAIHGCFLSFRFHCLLSALLCSSNMCTQISSPVSKLEMTITAFVCFQKFPSTFKALRLLLLSEQMRYPPSANLSQVQTLFQNCLHTDFWYASTTSYIFDRQSRILFDTIFTAAMLALVTEVLGLPGWVSSSTVNFPALKALTHLKTVRIEMVWDPYTCIPHNSLNICFESILSLMRHSI